MKKLNCILLIDDDRATNFIHKIILEKLNCANHIKVCEGSESALAYLIDNNCKNYIHPDLIFLDLNMPGMNGWELLKKYQNNVSSKYQHNSPIVILTTSFNPEDKEKAKKSTRIKDFVNKPLKKEVIINIIEKHF